MRLAYRTACGAQRLVDRTMSSTICIVRKGHLGDVVLTEPIAAAFRHIGWDVHLCTDCCDIGLCLATYTTVRPFDDYLSGRLSGYDRIHVLRYELHRRTHHLDAYAADAGVCLIRRIPQLRAHFGRRVDGRYGLICPDTSEWLSEMRKWPIERFLALRQLLTLATSVPWIVLKPENTFVEMMALIQHADCVVSNDSGPSHIAQAMGRITVVLFGSTAPEYLLVSPTAKAVVGASECTGCRHSAVDRSMRCTVPVCIDSISVQRVLDSVIGALSSRTTEELT
jgi:hypothetical protein